MKPIMQGRKRVAVVGSGCSGIGAVWALKTTDHEVHLFEANDRLGGHTNTVTWKHGGRKTEVDTGFIVMNSATYPNFIAFLKEINVATRPTDMTFGVSRDQGLFEWAGTSISAVFAQKSNLFRTRTWSMLFDIVRFNQFALDLLSDLEESKEDPTGANGSKSWGKPRQESIGDYLKREGYSEAFKDDYLIPMTASVWSTHPDKASLDFPAITLIRFLWNHHLLNTISARPTWMTIPGGSQQYIDAVMADFPQKQIHLGTGIKSMDIEENGQIRLLQEGGQTDVFDHVILATHGDQAMDIIRNIATAEEAAIMSEFNTSENTATLHSDLSLMPKRPIAWSSWNYITETAKAGGTVSSVCLTYWMNFLQHIPTETFGHVLVTLNPIHPPDPDTVQGSWTYHHPLYNAAAIHAQSILPKIQNTRGISYAGAWTKYGFHEDGFSSGVKVAKEHLGAKLPFEFVDSTFSRGRRPVLGWKDYVVRVLIRLVQVLVLLIGIGVDMIWSKHGKSTISSKQE